MSTILVGLVGFGVAIAAACAARRGLVAARVRQLRRGGRARLPRVVRQPLARALAAADVPIEPERAAQTAVLGVASATIAALAFMPGLAPGVVIAAAAAGPVGLRCGRHRRDRRFEVELPQLLDRVAAELRGGATVSTALTTAAHSDGPVAADVAAIRERLQLGLGLPDALAAWSADRDRADARAAAGALTVAVTLGGRATAAIEGLASSLRQRVELRAEGRALSAQGRLSAVVVGAAPVGFLAFSTMLDPASGALLVHGSVGRACLVGGLALEAAGAWWIRRIVASEPVA